ncbi:MAG: hypothetical protein ACI9ND_002573 [Yoonia sp.]|jgi:hypothetical protein
MSEIALFVGHEDHYVTAGKKDVLTAARLSVAPMMDWTDRG